MIREIKNLWNERATILKVVGVVVAIGLVIFLFSERLYYSEITLMPEVQSQQSTASQLLQQYGGLLGIGGSGELGTGTITPDQYPEIIVSTPFQLELIQEELYFSSLDTTVSLYTYYHELRDPPPFEVMGDFLWDITLGLPGTLRGLFSTSSPRPEINFEQYEDLETPLNLDGRIKEAISYSEDLISIFQQPQTGFIVVNAYLPDPEASARLVQAVKELVTEYVTEYRTGKAMRDLEFVTAQYQRSRNEFQTAQDSLARFRDRNMNLATAQAQTNVERLEAEYNLKFDVYNSIAQQLEQARLKVQEQTPVFSVLEPVSISRTPATPNTELIIVGSLFLGLIFGIGYIYGRTFYYYFIQEFNSK